LDFDDLHLLDSGEFDKGCNDIYIERIRIRIKSDESIDITQSDSFFDTSSKCSSHSDHHKNDHQKANWEI
jgi:hypothetical protein